METTRTLFEFACTEYSHELAKWNSSMLRTSSSLPIETLPSAGLAIAPVQAGKKGTGTALDALSTALRGLPCPIVGRIADDRLLLDCRCLDDANDVLSQLPQLKAHFA